MKRHKIVLSVIAILTLMFGSFQVKAASTQPIKKDFKIQPINDVGTQPIKKDFKIQPIKDCSTKPIPPKEVSIMPFIKLNYSKIGVIEGLTVQLTCSTGPKTDEIKWSSSNKGIATVDGNGLVKGIKAGEAVITAKANGLTDTCKVIVEKDKIIDIMPFIRLNKTEIKMTIGETAQLTCSTGPKTGEIKWSSSNEGIATVDGNGLVKGIKAGEAVITACANGVSATCNVSLMGRTGYIPFEPKKVSIMPFIKLSETDCRMFIGQTAQLTCSTGPKTDEIKWSSSNEGIATVDGNGLVKGISRGTSEIKAAANGITATCKVTVMPNGVIEIPKKGKLIISTRPNLRISSKFTYYKGTVMKNAILSTVPQTNK